MSDVYSNFEQLQGITETELAKAEAFAKGKGNSVLVIFFDDMKGSTALKQRMAALEDEEMFQALRREHDEVLTHSITRDRAGEVIKSTGDGLLAVFAEPSTAVERAIEIQEKLRAHPYIKVRIGLDMGQVRVEAAGGLQQDVFGRHVDWAARAEAMADPGHIIVTRSAYTDAFGWIPKTRVSWREHGFHAIKDDEQPIELFEPYNANVTQPMQHFPATKVSSSAAIPVRNDSSNVDRQLADRQGTEAASFFRQNSPRSNCGTGLGSTYVPQKRRACSIRLGGTFSR